MFDSNGEQPLSAMVSMVTKVRGGTLFVSPSLSPPYHFLSCVRKTHTQFFLSVVTCYITVVMVCWFQYSEHSAFQSLQCGGSLCAVMCMSCDPGQCGRGHVSG